MASERPKIIVIDDDPTGSQTVHSCPLLLRWTPDLVETGLDDPSSLLFILSNTRGLEAEAAAERTREICTTLKHVMERRRIPAVFISRSDSTLRGHFPLETDIMCAELGPFDGLFLAPAFFEGGRVTRDGIHYLREEHRLVRVDKTEYAHDSVFGYSSSYLPEYVAEKTEGRVSAKEVAVLPALSSENDYLERIPSVLGNECVAVDADGYKSLRPFATAVARLSASGKRFLFRSGASLVSAFADLPPQPVPGDKMGLLRRSDGPGIVFVGSHVSRTTEQLRVLLALPSVQGVELDVSLLPDHTAHCIAAMQKEVETAFHRGKTPVVYTSRQERSFPTKKERLEFGKMVSEALMAVAMTIPDSTSFVISKGGITSNDVLSTGLELSICRVIGQIIPGCTVVMTPNSHRFPNLPVVIFPGNVGGPEALKNVFEILSDRKLP